MVEELEITDPTVLETLYEPLRFRLFRLLETPRSVPELAGEVDMPTNRLYYHVRRLVQSGLIELVPALGKERVYQSRRVRFSGDVGLPPGGGPLQAIMAELSRGDFTEASPGLISWHVGALTKRRALELECRMQALIAEFADDGRGSRYGILGVVARLPR